MEPELSHEPEPVSKQNDSLEEPAMTDMFSRDETAAKPEKEMNLDSLLKSAREILLPGFKAFVFFFILTF